LFALSRWIYGVLKLRLYCYLNGIFLAKDANLAQQGRKKILYKLLSMFINPAMFFSFKIIESSFEKAW
jgi:hypothetical protein